MKIELEKRFVNKEKQDYFFSPITGCVCLYAEVIFISVTEQSYAKQSLAL